MSNDAFSTVSDLSGITMTGAKKISLLVTDLLKQYDLTVDESTVLRLELIESISKQIVEHQESIQQAIVV